MSSWKQPILTSNGAWGVDDFAVRGMGDTEDQIPVTVVPLEPAAPINSLYVGRNDSTSNSIAAQKNFSLC